MTNTKPASKGRKAPSVKGRRNPHSSCGKKRALIKVRLRNLEDALEHILSIVSDTEE